MQSSEPARAANENTIESGGRFLGRPAWTMLAQAVLSALLLILVCDWHSIYEEDQLAKTAQIISIEHNSNWKHYSETTDYYARDLFSAYYLTALGFYQLTGLPALESLNVFSMLCGVIFFSLTPTFLARVFKFPPWLSWFVLVSAPILVVSFNYGNEAALALAAASVAAFAMTFDNAVARIAAGAFYVVAAYARSDYLFLWPALSLLALTKNGNTAVDWRRSVRNVLPFFISSVVFGFAYLGLVLRHMPVDPGYYKAHFDPRLFAAFFIYSPNPVQFLFAIAGFGMCLARGRRWYLLALPVCIQFAPYITHFFSPKYFLPTVVVMLVFAIVAMLPLFKRWPLVLFCLLAVPWFIAITPFGVFGPKRSVYWYCPTDDGPLPTGSYLPFYAKVKEGFFQKRYDEEYRQLSGAMTRVINGKEKANLVGFFNIGSLRLWAVRNGLWDMPPVNSPYWRGDLGIENGVEVHYMIKTSYLYGYRAGKQVREQFKTACAEGRMHCDTKDPQNPFPDFIVVDQTRGSDPGDRELGQRILFMNDYYHNNQLLRQPEFLPDFQGVTWIPRARFEEAGLPKKSALYLDSHWVCLGQNYPNGIYYSMRFPMRYSSER